MQTKERNLVSVIRRPVSTNNFPLSILYSQFYYARLYTDKKFRENEFFKNDFSESEKSDIIFFAQSLINKRRGVVGGLIPETRTALGENFFNFFQKYAEEVPMRKDVLKHQWDTYLFLSFVLKKYNNDSVKAVSKKEQEKIIYALKPRLWLILRHPGHYLLRLTRLIFR